MATSNLKPVGFSSVKLPADLVEQARSAAQPLRRSVAGQVEYWATLGRIVEHSGLTAQEARDAIETYEAAARKARSAMAANMAANMAPDAQTDRLIADFVAVESDGSLASRVREVVADNRNKARRRPH